MLEDVAYEAAAVSPAGRTSARHAAQSAQHSSTLKPRVRRHDAAAPTLPGDASFVVLAEALPTATNAVTSVPDELALHLGLIELVVVQTSNDLRGPPLLKRFPARFAAENRSGAP